MKILAPNLDVMSDERVGLGGSMDRSGNVAYGMSGLASEEVLIDV